MSMNLGGPGSQTIKKIEATTIQTHNAVNVGASGSSHGSWIDSSGFDEIAVTMLNSGSTSSSVELYWSNDGVTAHGLEVLVGTGTSSTRAGSTKTKARYVRVTVLNGHTAPVTMSAWAYLKA